MEDAGIKPSESGTGLGTIAYLLGFFQVLGLVVNVLVFATSKDKFTRFHALQSLLTTAAFMCIMLIELVIALLLFITIIGYMVMIVVMIVTALSMLAFSVYMAIQASQGKSAMLPLVGNIARDHVA